MQILQRPRATAIPSLVEEKLSMSERFDEIVSKVGEGIAPVWPLQDFVAVNPFAGIAHRPFLNARAFLKTLSDCETLMPLEYYAAEYQKSKFTVDDIEAAIAELSHDGVAVRLSASEVVAKLQSTRASSAQADASNSDRRVFTIAEQVSKQTGFDWNEAIVNEVSKHCAAHYDQGQATWSSPLQGLSLYQAWRSTAELDRNIEFLGLRGFRKFVAELPRTPEAAIVYMLNKLDVPEHLWSNVLLCQAFSVSGWSAWTKYQTYWTDEAGTERNDFVGLLAIRLAYDAALASAELLRFNEFSFSNELSEPITSSTFASEADSRLRYLLLRASEIAFRNRLLTSIASSRVNSTSVDIRKLAQMVFCIDVRSERVRRQIESQNDNIETLGFAGFFAMPFEYVEIGQTVGKSQLPVLLKSKFKVHEGLAGNSVDQEAQVADSRHQQQTWRSTWKSFQASAASCFSFVETAGLGFGVELLRRAAGIRTEKTKPASETALGPTLRSLNEQGVTTARQAEMAEGMLRNIGLTENFAKLVVFCGHGCQTENNPLAAGLDCGACGGHSGEPNARFAALLLNQASIREALQERGICIPSDTCFVAAKHNTTTDHIEFFDTDSVPFEHQSALQELTESCKCATKQTQLERLPIVASDSAIALLKRASDWSEVRPEWGLAGNAAFIAAPRSMTASMDLDARAFLHSYDYTRDAGGKVLETILTAPVVVANWINMQYYASTVDNQHFGSGTKTIHNVVGRFGIVAGNGGDLLTGLPWQSLHTGSDYQHRPLRLQVVIAAPRAMIDDVIAKHPSVANLFNNAWMHLVAIESGTFYRYATGKWDLLTID